MRRNKGGDEDTGPKYHDFTKLSSKKILDLRFGPLELWLPTIRERYAIRAF